MEPVEPRELRIANLLTLPTTLYDVSVLCNRFSKTEMRQFSPSVTDGLTPQFLAEKILVMFRNFDILSYQALTTSKYRKIRTTCPRKLRKIILGQAIRVSKG